MIGLLTIGQSPRPDITRNFIGFDIIEGGALDGLSREEVDRDFSPGADDIEAGRTVYVSRWSDGSEVKVLKSAIRGGLQQRINEIADQCAAIVVLCTGTFEDLQSPVPLVFPDHVLRSVVAGRNLGEHLHVVMPSAEQQTFLEGKWEDVTEQRSFSSASPYRPFPAQDVAEAVLSSGTPTAVVLDCMGFTSEHQKALGHALERTGVPVPPIILPQQEIPEYVASM
jgi:protein AroM